MMREIEEVAEGTYRIETGIPGLPTIFTIYLINEKGNGVLIEPGPTALVPTIEKAIKQIGIRNLEYIIPTHVHLDHAAAVGSLAQLFPQAQVLVNAQGAKHIIDPTRLIRSTKMAYGDDFENVYGAILPVPESQVRIVKDKDRISFGSHELLILNTPGHAPHHIAIFDTKTRGLFCGEALGLIYVAGAPPLPAVPAPSFDGGAYLANMERLKALKPSLLFYSHGGIGKNPENLISTVLHNTRAIGDVIFETLQSTELEEVVIDRVRDYIWDNFGIRLDEWELATNVKGYIHYFKNHQDHWLKPA